MSEKKIRKRTCLGCYAHEEGNRPWSNDYCALGFKTKVTDMRAGFYGKAKMLVGCRCAPAEECPKPMTLRSFLKAHKQNRGT